MFVQQKSMALSFASESEDRIKRGMKSSSFTAISLYSGAGGLDLGFARAGIQSLWSIDADADAVSTYNANLNPVAVCGDVLRVAPPDGLNVDVVFGGPPCQGFSVIGNMDPDDPRSRHVNHFLDVVEQQAPSAFVMENVKALATNARWSAIRESLVSRAEELGYETRLFVLNARDFGVPQSRERMFLVGVKGVIPSAPKPTTADSPPTVRSALAGLPRYGSPGNDSRCNARIVPSKSPIMRPTAYNGSLLFNGSGRPQDLDQPAKTLPASMGGNATPIIDQLELDDDAEPWVVDYHGRLASGGRPLKKAPARLRRITVEEAAALQTFPEDWRFIGPRGNQYRQIGNAVPPALAEAVASQLVESLEFVRSTAQLAAA